MFDIHFKEYFINLMQIAKHVVNVILGQSNQCLQNIQNEVTACLLRHYFSKELNMVLGKYPSGTCQGLLMPRCCTNWFSSHHIHQQYILPNRIFIYKSQIPLPIRKFTYILSAKVREYFLAINLGHSSAAGGIYEVCL